MLSLIQDKAIHQLEIEQENAYNMMLSKKRNIQDALNYK